MPTPVVVADTVTLAPETVAPLVGAVRVTVGAVVSVTVTVNDAVLVFRRVSAAVQLTVVTPIGNVDPLGGTQVTATLPSTASTAVAVYVKIAPDGPVAGILAFAGTVMTGGVVSTTVTVNDAVRELLRVSLAVHVTVVRPSGNVAPLAGRQLTGREPSTMSDADATYVK